MGRVCCVGSCRRSSKKYPELRFFNIPSVISNQCTKTKVLSEKRRKEWMKKLSLSPSSVKNQRVCSRHFYSGLPSKLFEDSNPNWVPKISPVKPFTTSTPVLCRARGRLSFSSMSMAAVADDPQIDEVKEFSHDTGIESCSGEPFCMSDIRSSESTDFHDHSYPGVEEIETENIGGASEMVSNIEIHIVKLGRDQEVQTEEIFKNDQGIQTERLFKNNQGVQTKIFVKDKITQTQTFPKENKVVQTEMLDISDGIQTDIISSETQTVETESLPVETQTMFRVCFTFELEAAELELRKLKTQLDELILNIKSETKKTEEAKLQLQSEKLKLEASEKKFKCKSYFEDSFEGDDERVKFFTGIDSFRYLIVIYDQIKPYLFKRSKLTKFQQYILTLMKLRLALSNRHLSYIFDVSDNTIGRLFYNTLNALYKRLSRCIHWPERENLQATMPRCFRDHFGNQVAVIIDCFEVFTEKPSSLISRAETWSNYKHNNTVKFLIGITPQGTVSFISKGWGGRVSDQLLTISSGILEKLIPGDVILADRGFDIADEVAFYCASIKIPAFTKGLSQLDPYDVEKTRKLANVRIHVERVIGSIRQKYAILHSKIPVELLDSVPDEEVSTVDKIALVACALTNLCASIVPMD